MTTLCTTSSTQLRYAFKYLLYHQGYPCIQTAFGQPLMTLMSLWPTQGLETLITTLTLWKYAKREREREFTCTTSWDRHIVSFCTSLKTFNIYNKFQDKKKIKKIIIIRLIQKNILKKHQPFSSSEEFSCTFETSLLVVPVAYPSSENIIYTS